MDAPREFTEEDYEQIHELNDQLKEAMKLISEAECGMHEYEEELYRHNWFKRVEVLEKRVKGG